MYKTRKYNINFVVNLIKNSVFNPNFNTLKSILNNKNIENNEKIVYEIIESNPLSFFTKQTKINSYLIYNAIFLENATAKKVLQSLLASKEMHSSVFDDNIVKKTDELIKKYNIKKEHSLLTKTLNDNLKTIHKKL